MTTTPEPAARRRDNYGQIAETVHGGMTINVSARPRTGDPLPAHMAPIVRGAADELTEVEGLLRGRMWSRADTDFVLNIAQRLQNVHQALDEL
jgi:hypothetical protein